MDPILNDFPTQITTDRLLIRMPQYNDGKQIYESIIASQDELKVWLPFANEEITEQGVELETRQAHIRYLQRTNLRMYIFEKESHIFVGTTGLHNINWDVLSFEIGYWLDSRQTGKGYMTEVVKGLTEFAFKELHAQRLMIKCDTNNLKSRAVAERAGFILEGILKRDSLSTDGSKLRDTMVFAKTI